MKEIIINQFEDANCELTLKTQSGGTLNLSAVNIKAFAVIKDGTGTEIVKYAKTPSAGWLGLDNTKMNLGTYKFIVLSSLTKTLKPGRYYVELTARFPSAVHVDGYYDVVEEFYLFTVKKSLTATLTLP